MRLELEQNHLQSGFAVDADDGSAVDRAAESANHLREGIRAAQSGNRAAARTALLRAAELDPQSESAWMWLSSISEYPEELLAFLTNVLEINPQNARALEWATATKSLLAKNLVQRGIDAAEADQNDHAAQLFNQALEYDERNSMAWLWLASLCDSTEGKLSYLEKVLEYEPENETAKAGYQAAKNSIREGLLAEARTAAVTGNSQAANELLDAVIAEEPDAEDAWVLKSHIAVSFEEKIAAFRQVLDINPENNVARAGLESLTAIMEAVGTSSQPAEDEQPQPAFEPEADLTAGADLGGESEPFVYTEPVFEAEVSVAADDGWQQQDDLEPAHEEPVLERSATDFEETFFEAEEQEQMPPFDNPADEPVVDHSGTMLMTTSDLDFDLNELAELTATSEPLSEGFSENGGDPEPADRSAEMSEAYDEEPAASEPDEITYEMVPEVAEADLEEILTADETVDEPFARPDLAEELSVFEPVSDDDDEAPAWNNGAISAPSGNPFESEVFRNEPSTYETVLSSSPSSFTSGGDDVPAPSNGNSDSTFFNIPFDSARYAGTIPMPESGLEPLAPAAAAPTGYETRIVTPSTPTHTGDAGTACPFCRTTNDVQAIACNGCLAVLTLADLELVLANHHADRDLVRCAVNEMEGERSHRQLSEAELTTLGIGHLNLRNLQEGYDCLHEAAQLNPNNVVLSSQANALLIRLEEIKEQAVAHNSMVKGKTILVVDDSPTVRKLIAGKLEKSGHDVLCCGDGVEAMDRLSTVKPDLILLDITMPRMDGYQVCKLIRGDDATKDTPVVMISGKDGFFDKVRGRMAGCSGYITKPFGPETLMKAVESYLNPEA